MPADATTPYRLNDVVRRLEGSLSDLEFALDMVPERWIHGTIPGAPEDAWTVAMNVAHLAVYEEVTALPLLGSFMPGFDLAAARQERGAESWFLDLATALAREPIEAMLARLRAARASQIDIVHTLGEHALNDRTTPLWPDPQHTAGWVATKTFQHTWEHGNAVLRAALFAPR